MPSGRSALRARGTPRARPWTARRRGGHRRTPARGGAVGERLGCRAAQELGRARGGPPRRRVSVTWLSLRVGDVAVRDGRDTRSSVQKSGVGRRRRRRRRRSPPLRSRGHSRRGRRRLSFVVHLVIVFCVRREALARGRASSRRARRAGRRPGSRRSSIVLSVDGERGGPGRVRDRHHRWTTQVVGESELRGDEEHWAQDRIEERSERRGSGTSRSRGSGLSPAISTMRSPHGARRVHVDDDAEVVRGPERAEVERPLVRTRVAEAPRRSSQRPCRRSTHGVAFVESMAVARHLLVGIQAYSLLVSCAAIAASRVRRSRSWRRCRRACSRCRRATASCVLNHRTRKRTETHAATPAQIDADERLVAHAVAERPDEVGQLRAAPRAG